MTTLAAAPIAPVAETLVGGRPVRDYVDFRQHPAHSHGLDTTVGYVLRETIRDRQSLGPDYIDVAVFDGDHRYGTALDLAHVYRAADGGYAVVDTLYACGCRS